MGTKSGQIVLTFFTPGFKLVLNKKDNLKVIVLRAGSGSPTQNARILTKATGQTGEGCESE